MAKRDGDPKYLKREIGPDGVERLYAYKRGAQKIRIREAFGTATFWRVFADALESLNSPLQVVPQQPQKKGKGGWEYGTLGWLAEKYYESDEFNALDPDSQKTRRSVIGGCLKESHSETDKRVMGHCPVKFLTPKKVKRLRDLKGAALPGAANNRKKYLSAMFGWAIENDLMATNPARDVRRKEYATSGFHTWSEAEVTAYEKFYPIGTKARLALALYVYLGVRKSDMVRLGPKNIHESTMQGEPRTIRFNVRKTRKRKARESVKPILPELERILAASPCGAQTFLQTRRGNPYTAKGFGNKMREWCDAAGLPGCSSHGLRKVGATRCAEGGATEPQMMAIFDWDTPSQAAVYIKEANRKRMALASAHMLGTPRVH